MLPNKPVILCGTRGGSGARGPEGPAHHAGSEGPVVNSARSRYHRFWLAKIRRIVPWRGAGLWPVPRQGYLHRGGNVICLTASINVIRSQQCQKNHGTLIISPSSGHGPAARLRIPPLMANQLS